MSMSVLQVRLEENLNLLSAMRALNEEAITNGIAGMSEDEIEAEIKAARAEKKGH